MRGPTRNAAFPTVASPSNLVVVGRKLGRIRNWANLPEADLLEEDDQATAVASIGGGDQCTVRVAAAAGALIRGNGFGSLQKTVRIASDRPLEGPASAPTAARARLLADIPSARPGPAACVAWRMHNNCLPAARCIRGTTLLGKIDNPQFAPLRLHIDPEKSGLSRAWLCSMAQVEPLEATGS